MNTRHLRLSDELRAALRTTALAVGALGLVSLAACGPPERALNAQAPVVAPATPNGPTDMQLTSQIRGSLKGDEMLSGQTIEVQTVAGEVRLSGVLQNQAQKDQALLVARGVSGVRGVQDETTLQQ